MGMIVLLPVNVRRRRRQLVASEVEREDQRDNDDQTRDQRRLASKRMERRAAPFDATSGAGARRERCWQRVCQIHRGGAPTSSVD
ncbi:MAG: hypothetical protein IVW36_04690 [Dehalococcoidia bacterium]|nr:hypothetical protein [Dehalococcoidia bacterium]